MRQSSTIIVFLIWVLLISVGDFTLSMVIKDEIKKIKTDVEERMVPLIRDSIKMHQWYENWELTYQEKNQIKDL